MYIKKNAQHSTTISCICWVAFFLFFWRCKNKKNCQYKYFCHKVNFDFATLIHSLTGSLCFKVSENDNKLNVHLESISSSVFINQKFISDPKYRKDLILKLQWNKIKVQISALVVGTDQQRSVNNLLTSTYQYIVKVFYIK